MDMYGKEGKQLDNRSGIKVMAGLIGMVKPLMGYMILAVTMGCIGNLCAVFITVLGSMGLLSFLGLPGMPGFYTIVTALAVIAVLRGILRYSEQACNHFIAFKLLARIRHQVFAALRKLAPAKLEGRDRGNLISVITSDIELLEVFYAHTISPVLIALITSVVMVIFIGSYQISLGILAGISYLVVGAVIPVINGRSGGESGLKYRNEIGGLNTVVLDNLRGLNEIHQYDAGDERGRMMDQKTRALEGMQKRLKKLENRQSVATDLFILAASALAVVFLSGQTDQPLLLLPAVIAFMGSFGPTAALGSLSNNLNQTLAAGSRVLDILKEEPGVLDVIRGENFHNGDIKATGVDFSYENEKILKNLTASFPKGKVTGILGPSGCGKSTLLKLLMRFFTTDRGEITYHRTDVNEIKTSSLRDHISYVTQETFLFHDTIENNIKVSNLKADRPQVEEAARKASLHDFVQSLPKGYDTRLSELGESLSGGERQRIGLARAFLHEGEIIFLDEPTSNLDSLNEGAVLKSLKEGCKDKTILLVSHRKSTMNIADKILEF